MQTPPKDSNDTTEGSGSVLDQILEQYDQEFIKVTGYDDCVIGVCSRAGSELFLMYDREKLLQKTCEVEGWSMEASVEWHEFNTFGAWYGETTPGFMELPYE